MYEKRDYNNTWEGQSRDGRKLPDGTYYYVLYLDVSEGMVYKGDVTVLR